MISENMPMTSAQPYLIRAFFDWILDNGMTPFLLVQAGLPGVNVPAQHVKDGKVVLNINPEAVRHLELANEGICFDARFNGVSMRVSFPVEAVLAIYAKENGQGMNFDLIGGFADDSQDNEGHAEENVASSDDECPPPRPPSGRPNLTLVK